MPFNVDDIGPWCTRFVFPSQQTLTRYALKALESESIEDWKRKAFVSHLRASHIKQFNPLVYKFMEELVDLGKMLSDSHKIAATLKRRINKAQSRLE